MTVSRSLTNEDCDAMAALHAAAFPASEAWPISAFSEIMSQSSTHAEGVFMQGTLKSMLVVQFVLGEAEIITLATAPDARKHGLASQNLIRLEQKLRALGLRKWLLDVAADNTGARAFYEKHGFDVDGVRANYYKRLEGHRIDAILMTKPVGGQMTA